MFFFLCEILGQEAKINWEISFCWSNKSDFLHVKLIYIPQKYEDSTNKKCNPKQQFYFPRGVKIYGEARS